MAAISVLIPVYNTDRYIAKAIESVQRQTYEDWELIIVDDCSGDDTYNICKHYASADNRIKLYRNPENLGMMRNWNRGLELCNSEYFIKLDADDWWDADMLLACKHIMDKYDEVGLTFVRFEEVDQNGAKITNSLPLPDFANDRYFDGQDLVNRGTYGVLTENVLRQGIGLIRRKIFNELGFFSLHDAGDTEMWFRIAAHYKVYGINRVLHYYRIWSSNFTRTHVIHVGKAERNLFEVRQMIFDYYHCQRLLGEKQYKRFQRDNMYEMNKYLIFKNRAEGNYLRMIALLARNFIQQPLETIQFYIKRSRDKYFKNDLTH